MAKMAAKCIVDTNVPKIANSNTATISEDMLECALACVEKIQKILDGKLSLVLDAGGEIFTEYQRQLSMSGQSGTGDAFMKWVHDNQWNFSDEDRVTITKIDGGYEEFPDCTELKDFDKSDMKFVAVANAHSAKPPILVASDHKWWTFKESLEKNGITAEFLCPAQVQQASIRKTKRK